MLRLFNLHCVLFLALALMSCDSGLGTDSEVQYVSEVAWLPDGSSMLGFVQYFVSSPIDPDPPLVYDIMRIDETGKIGVTYNKKEPAYETYYYNILLSLFLSADHTVIAQLGSNVYRINLTSGAEEKMLTDFHLTTVSPDGRFVVGTHSQKRVWRKSIYVYDVATTPVREVTRFEVDSLSPFPGLWLKDGQFAVTVQDSAETNEGAPGWHIDVYDTTGAFFARIGAARTAPHNSKFISSTNHLYYRTNDGSVGMYDLSAETVSQPIHFGVQNFDISSDERYMYYVTAINGSLKRYEIATAEEVELATGVFWGAFLSPDEQKIACVREKRTNFQEVKVIALP
jgi:hypothetical protein